MERRTLHAPYHDHHDRGQGCRVAAYRYHLYCLEEKVIPDETYEGYGGGALDPADMERIRQALGTTAATDVGQVGDSTPAPECRPRPADFGRSRGLAPDISPEAVRARLDMSGLPDDPYL